MNVKNEKKVLVLSFLGVITFIAVVVGATFAYFTAQGGGTRNINVNANTATTDNLSFQTGSAISLTANQEDFGSGAGNKSGSTYARATLTANNATNNATRNYYVYLNIESNDFEYTTADEQAELLLKVTNPDGTEVTTLGSLERKTSGSGANQVEGFDITTQTGLITIADNYEITSTGTETQEWQVEVIFANLDSDQNANTGKSFSANLIIQEEPIVTNLGNFAEYIANLYTTDGANDLYYHDGNGTYGSQEAGDNSYRYVGANPNNYVCFGSDAASCPTDNLYRIIGVFNNQVKLIKSTYSTSASLGTNGDYHNEKDYNDETISTYCWNCSTGTNTWSESALNTVNLNANYLNSLGTEWSDLIATTNWQVGGMAHDNVLGTNAQTVYNYEVGVNTANTTYNAKIGLMYVSDYGYAASPEAWSLSVGYVDGGTSDYTNTINTENNWLLPTYVDWTISSYSDRSNIAFRVNLAGYVHNGYVSNDLGGVRPSFYLESSVVLERGSGTSADPYRIS